MADHKPGEVTCGHCANCGPPSVEFIDQMERYIMSKYRNASVMHDIRRYAGIDASGMRDWPADLRAASAGRLAHLGFVPGTELIKGDTFLERLVEYLKLKRPHDWNICADLVYEFRWHAFLTVHKVTELMQEKLDPEEANARDRLFRYIHSQTVETQAIILTVLFHFDACSLVEPSGN